MTIGKSEALVADISMGAQTSPNAVFALAHQILVGLGVRRAAARASPKLPSPANATRLLIVARATSQVGDR